MWNNSPKKRLEKGWKSLEKLEKKWYVAENKHLMTESNEPKTEFEYYKLLIEKVWACAQKDILFSTTLSQGDAKNIVNLIKLQTDRDLNERTLRNAFKKLTEDNARLPSPYTLETLAQFVLGEKNPEMEASPTWWKFMNLESQQISLAGNSVQKQSYDQSEVPKKGKRKRKKLLFLWLVLPIIGLIYLAQSFHSKPENFTEDFNSADLSYLKANGWKILYPNYEWLKRQPSIDSGLFTLWTLPGDNWIKPGEQRKITNLLIHKVENNNFETVLKICNFAPNQGYSQQIGLFLLDENLNLATCIRQSFVFTPSETEKYRILNVELFRFENGELVFFTYKHFSELSTESKDMLKKMIIRIVLNNNRVHSDSKFGGEWNLWHKAPDSTRINFKVAYVGIAAFQGWTLNDGTPKNADTIPAKLDYFKIIYH